MSTRTPQEEASEFFHPTQHPLILSPQEAARLTGLSLSRVYELARSGEWPTVRRFRKVMIRTDGLLAWIEKHSTGNGHGDR